MLVNVAELEAGRMEETIGKASLRDAAIGTGIAVDKMLALTGQTPALQIAVVLQHRKRRQNAVRGTQGLTPSHDASWSRRSRVLSCRRGVD